MWRTGKVNKTNNNAWIGRSIARLEDPALLRGGARFADDLATPANVCHAAFMRSPIAHGEIVALDTAAARAMPGVVAIITGAGQGVGKGIARCMAKAGARCVIADFNEKSGRQVGNLKKH